MKIMFGTKEHGFPGNAGPLDSDPFAAMGIVARIMEARDQGCTLVRIISREETVDLDVEETDLLEIIDRVESMV